MTFVKYLMNKIMFEISDVCMKKKKKKKYVYLINIVCSYTNSAI